MIAQIAYLSAILMMTTMMTLMTGGVLYKFFTFSTLLSPTYVSAGSSVKKPLRFDWLSLTLKSVLKQCQLVKDSATAFVAAKLLPLRLMITVSAMHPVDHR